jgi:hypothetical protein
LFTAGFVEKITCRLAAHPGENEAPYIHLIWKYFSVGAFRMCYS